MTNNTQQPRPAEEGIYVSLYPEEFVTPELRMRCLEAARGARLFVSSVAPDIEVALVHRMLLIAHRGFVHMHRSRPDGPDCVVQEVVTIGFVNHDAEGIDLRFWTIPFAVDVLSALDLEIRAWWSSLVDARRTELSGSFDDEPRIDWQRAPRPERANARQKPEMAATAIQKGASKNRKKSEKNNREAQLARVPDKILAEKSLDWTQNVQWASNPSERKHENYEQRRRKPAGLRLQGDSPERLREITEDMKVNDIRLWRQMFPEEAQAEQAAEDAERRARAQATVEKLRAFILAEARGEA
jgi:hypothetical protein